MLISLILYNKCTYYTYLEHYVRANFPTDSDGKLCGIDYPAYSYIYFASVSQIKQRLCVSKCPLSTDKKLHCKATQTRGCYFNSFEDFRVEYYETEAIQDRNGKFCLPVNEQERTLITELTGLKARGIYMNTEDSFITCTWVAIILAFVFGIIVQFLPKHVNQWLPYCGAVMLFVLAISTLTYPTSMLQSKIIIGIILTFVLLLVILTIFRFSKPIKYNGVFLQISTKFVKQYPLLLINIPIFMAIFIVAEYIVVLELNSIWTSANLDFNAQSSLYWQYVSGGAKIMSLLLIIQAIWLFFFIKESFNFIISGYLILWYYNKLSGNCFFPYKIFFTKHIGSVFACAFMTGFFGIYDTVFDFLRSFIGEPDNDKFSIYGSIKKFLDLVRSEALVYIIFSSNAYCNSARYCEYLCFKGDYLINGSDQKDTSQEFSQSVSRTYRISAYAVLGGFVSFLGLYFHGHISIYGMGLIILTSYFIINLVVQLHADSADSLMVIYMNNQQFAARKEQYSFPNQKRKNLNNKKFKLFAQKHGITDHLIEAFQKDQKQREIKECWNCWSIENYFK